MAEPGPPPSTIFYDVEASSLSRDSYPVEVGWAEVLADGSVRSEALLVRRAPGWLDWSEHAQQVHGITRVDLQKHGRSADEVVAVLDAAFGSSVVFSDAPASEVFWTDRLYGAAGKKRVWRIGDAIPLLRATAASREDSFWLSVHLEEARLHRADADARVLADGLAELRRRRMTRERSGA